MRHVRIALGDTERILVNLGAGALPWRICCTRCVDIAHTSAVRSSLGPVSIMAVRTYRREAPIFLAHYLYDAKSDIYAKVY